MSFSQKREASVESESKVDISGPHITNLNEDHQLSGKVLYNFIKTPLLVGRRNANTPNDILLSSSSVSIKHCHFDTDADGNILLVPVDEKSSKFLFINGDRVTQPTILNHLDRIIIGTSTVFLFKLPGGVSAVKEHDIDFGFALEEKTKNDEEEIEKAIPKQSSRTSKQLPPLEMPSVDRVSEISNIPNVSNGSNVSNVSIESSIMSPQIINDSVVNSSFNNSSEVTNSTAPSLNPAIHNEHHEEPLNKKKQKLHNKLAKLFPLINEANMLASDLGRHVKCAAKIINILPDDVKDEEDLEPERWEKELKVEVINQDYGLIWY